MKKNKIEIIITSILVIILIFFIANIFKGKGRGVAKKKTTKIVTTDTKQPQESIALTKETFENLEDKAKALKLGRDPFVYRPRLIRVTGDLRLEGIVWDEESPKAVINGNIVGIGDKIGDNEVVDIRKDSVILHNGTNILNLHWGN